MCHRLIPLLGLRWIQLVMTLSGQAVAGFIFGSWAGIISISNLVIVVDGLLAIACLLLAMSNAEARENRQNGIFVLLIGFVIFLQIMITPRAGVPHHYSMIPSSFARPRFLYEIAVHGDCSAQLSTFNELLAL